jgi:hypothetical protein
MHAAHAVPKRPTLLTIPALPQERAPDPAPTVLTQPSDYSPAAGVYAILFSILAALMFGVFVQA